MFDELCRLTFIFVNGLYVQYGAAVFLAVGGEKAADIGQAAGFVLPDFCRVANQLGLHFKASQIAFAGIQLPGFMFQQQPQNGGAGEGVAQRIGCFDAGCQADGVFQIKLR